MEVIHEFPDFLQSYPQISRFSMEISTTKIFSWNRAIDYFWLNIARAELNTLIDFFIVMIIFIPYFWECLLAVTMRDNVKCRTKCAWMPQELSTKAKTQGQLLPIFCHQSVTCAESHILANHLIGSEIQKPSASTYVFNSRRFQQFFTI